AAYRALHVLQAGIVANGTLAAPDIVMGVGTATVGATDQPSQVIGGSLLVSLSAGSLLTERLLHRLPDLRLEDRLVRAVLAPLSENIVANVGLILEQILGPGGVPLPVRHHLQVVAHRSNGTLLQVQTKSMAYDLSLLRDHDEALWGLLVVARHHAGIRG